MPTAPTFARHRLRRYAISVLAVAAAVGACGGGDERPVATSWQGVWEARQALVPDAATVLDGGPDLCGERLGVFRTDMPALRPTPSEALDRAVDAWVDHAEAIVFECPTDPVDLDERYETLDALASEVDAGLLAAQDG